ncbi:hypothetical protein PV396_24670 [Streptomyces sp. ME02-8801-2C]|uniref:hypothetical protein n=1 Tax=Streptomyces sp. ME02-8801-2C TaxID=3028680 RepID=UPI0029AB9A93|nr:hypothetical protein [Streptomyces sp. ME02-8801-2C]MDX3455097.1 hypothetical protein [Streptomyces sp. ME02-8801-2C]
MSRHLQHRLHTQLVTAVAVLDLPLTDLDLERLAVEMTAPVKAMLAEALATADEQAPLAVSVAVPVISAGPHPDVDEAAGVETSEYAGCVSRIGLEIDLDSPAAVLADKLRSSQPDVIATDVPDAATLGLTVRPQSIDCWRWWLSHLNVPVGAVETHGDAATATGQYKGVTIQLRGDGVPELLTDRAAARLAGVIAGGPAGHPW